MRNLKSMICLITIIMISISCNEDDSIIYKESELQEYILKKKPNLVIENYENLKLRKITEPIFINNYKELDSFLEKIKKNKKTEIILRGPGDDNGIHEPPPGQGGGSGSGIIEFNFLVSVGCYINVRFNISDNCTGSGLTSYMSGWQLGTSYTHIDGTLSSNDNIDDCVISFSTRGLIHYNLIFEGIGTVFSEPIDLTGTYYR